MVFSKRIIALCLISFYVIFFGEIKAQGRTVIDDEIFRNPEINPIWKSCISGSLSNSEIRKCSDEKLLVFISSNLKCPKETACFSGRIIVQIIIKKDGSISNLKFLRDCPESWKREVKKVFDKMPNWKPGTFEGKPIDMNFTIPIKIRLSK